MEFKTSTQATFFQYGSHSGFIRVISKRLAEVHLLLQNGNGTTITQIGTYARLNETSKKQVLADVWNQIESGWLEELQQTAERIHGIPFRSTRY